MSGEHQAYNEIVNRYESRVFSLVLMMTRDRPGSEELTQDTFLRAYSNLRKFDLERPLYPWLATIAARLGMNWINRTGARCLLWGSDHPHPEGTFPHSQSAVAEQIENTPKEIADAVLWGNAAELYGFEKPPGA